MTDWQVSFNTALSWWISSELKIHETYKGNVLLKLKFILWTFRVFIPISRRIILDEFIFATLDLSARWEQGGEIIKNSIISVKTFSSTSRISKYENMHRWRNAILKVYLSSHFTLTLLYMIWKTIILFWIFNPFKIIVCFDIVDMG